MGKIIINKNGSHILPLTDTEKEAISLVELEETLTPSLEIVGEAEFEIKIITLLIELGVIS